MSEKKTGCLNKSPISTNYKRTVNILWNCFHDNLFFFVLLTENTCFTIGFNALLNLSGNPAITILGIIGYNIKFIHFIHFILPVPFLLMFGRLLPPHHE